MDPPADISVVYIRPEKGGWTMALDDQRQHFTTATGAIYTGIQEGRALARAGREVWVLWRNGEAWSVAWTSDADRTLVDRIDSAAPGPGPGG